MPKLPWHLVTGEYPPHPGGVGDYSRQLAEALARAGETVHIWTGGTAGTSVESEGVVVHRVAGGFRSADLVRLTNALVETPGPRRLFIQYVAQSYGCRAMNVGFCRWVSRRRKAGDDVWTMFHEVRVEFLLRNRPRIWLVSAVTRVMSRMVHKASSKVFVTIPAWKDSLAPLKGMPPVRWLPVPSNIPVNQNPAAVKSLRERLSANSSIVIGTFGTYHHWIRQQLRDVFFQLLEGHPDRMAWILGRSGDEFAAELLAERPDLEGRIVGPGMLTPDEASLYLQGCDLLVQPFPDGVSTRRTSLMAAIAHGRPVVTTTGHLCEPLWAETHAVRLTSPGKPEEMVAAVEELLADSEKRDELSRRALQLYENEFALDRALEVLLTEAKPSP